MAETNRKIQRETDSERGSDRERHRYIDTQRKTQGDKDIAYTLRETARDSEREQEERDREREGRE